jgi:hypothetical protein
MQRNLFICGLRVGIVNYRIDISHIYFEMER